MAFKHCLTEDISCHKLLQRMRRYLKKHGYPQVPQMHSEEFLRLDEPFAAYTCKAKAAPVDSNPAQAPKTRDLQINIGSPAGSNNVNMLPSSTGSLDEQLKEMEAHLDYLRKKKAAEGGKNDMAATYGGPGTISSISTTPSQGGFNNFSAAAPDSRQNPQSMYNNQNPQYMDNEIDNEITEMENHLRTLQRKKQSLGLSNAGDVDAQIASVEAHLQRLKTQKHQSPMFKQAGYGAQGTGSQPSSNQAFSATMTSGFSSHAPQQPRNGMRW